MFTLEVSVTRPAGVTDPVGYGYGILAGNQLYHIPTHRRGALPKESPDSLESVIFIS